MPTDGSGNFTLVAGYEAVTGEDILPSQHNPPLEDLAENMTAKVHRDGRSAMTGSLNMGTNRIINVTNPSSGQDAATKAYVDALAGWETGDVKLTMRTTATSGWVMCNDGTIGSASSGATTRANADTATLYALLWANVSDTYAPVSGGRGASAGDDFSANKTIALTKMLGRALALSGAGSGLTSRALGLTIGSEAIIRADLPNTSVTVDITDPGHTHGHSLGTAGGTTNPLGSNDNNAGTKQTASATTGISAAFNLNGNVTQTASSKLQPSAFLNAMIKL